MYVSSDNILVFGAVLNMDAECQRLKSCYILSWAQVSQWKWNTTAPDKTALSPCMWIIAKRFDNRQSIFTCVSSEYGCWMLVISMLFACIGITKEVYQYKTIQTCLKPSSVDNCQDLSPVTSFIRRYYAKENISLQDESELYFLCEQLTRHMCLQTVHWQFWRCLKMDAEYSWLIYVLLHTVSVITITKKLYHYKTRNNCLKSAWGQLPRHMCHQRIDKHFGKFWIWMMNVSGLSAHTCCVRYRYHKEKSIITMWWRTVLILCIF